MWVKDGSRNQPKVDVKSDRSIKDFERSVEVCKVVESGLQGIVKEGEKICICTKDTKVCS